MDLTRFLNQVVSYEALTGTDDRDDKTYASAVATKARKEEKTTLIYKSLSETVTSTTAVWMLAEPTLGDRIDGREVIGRDSLVEVGGRVAGWKALLR